ncbi:MAG: oxygen-independent coproporphyrinogen III oxidase [Lachnospiraceae bacterium]|nr:oxygen-independent coproporphyrinogen III oxidase [Lachnospiraceae bacterium]
MKISKDIEIYIHIPFCVKKCCYCDFLSFQSDNHMIEDYIDALLKEMRAKSVKDMEADTVFIGGGTPSILKPDYIEIIMSELRKCFNVKKEAEITIEANPGTITAGKAQAYVNSGINRVSIGLQTAQDAELKKLGRIHTWQQFLDSYNILREEGINNINVDIMSGLPLQSIEMYKDTVHKVCMLSPEHISAYSLIVEEGTPFYDMYNQESGRLKDELPNEEEERQQYYMTDKILTGYGYKRYEISNYAKSGFECRHNIGYWKRKPYIGLGLGAASLYSEKRFNNTSDIKKYISNSEYPEKITENIQILSTKEQMEEYMFLGMRMMEGVSRSTFMQKFGNDMDEIYGNVISKYSKIGMTDIDGDRVFLTKKGIDVSNVVFSDFLLDD